MSKALSEAYLSYMYDKEPHTNRKGKTRPRERRQKSQQIDGQIKFVTDDGGGFRVDDGEGARKQRLKEDSLAYYDAFYEMLRRYGKFNMHDCLWNALQAEHPSRDAINALNYHYDGKLENVQSALDRSRYWLGQARMKFGKAAERVDIFDIDTRFDDAYRDRERREKFYAFIRRERKKVADDKTTVLYTPQDFEANYQQNRAKRAARRLG